MRYRTKLNVKSIQGNQKISSSRIIHFPSPHGCWSCHLIAEGATIRRLYSLHIYMLRRLKGRDGSGCIIRGRKIYYRQYIQQPSRPILGPTRLDSTAAMHSLPRRKQSTCRGSSTYGEGSRRWHSFHMRSGSAVPLNDDSKHHRDACTCLGAV